MLVSTDMRKSSEQQINNTRSIPAITYYMFPLLLKTYTITNSLFYTLFFHTFTF